MNWPVELVGIVIRSLVISLSAVLISSALGVPLGTLVGLRRFKGRRLAMRLLYTFSGLPPVVAGLLVYLLLSRRGLLGPLEMLYTPGAMIIAQVCLAFPIVACLTSVAVAGRDREARDLARTLGATELQADLAVVREARPAILAAVISAYARVSAEVGAVMMVGGNIRGYTRVMTTSIVLETRRGNLELALSLGLILLVVSFVVNSLVLRLEGGVGLWRRPAGYGTSTSLSPGGRSFPWTN